MKRVQRARIAEFGNQRGVVSDFVMAGKELSEQALSDTARKAVSQIREKQYSTEMEYRGITKIGFFGIAFCGKKVACSYEERKEG